MSENVSEKDGYELEDWRKHYDSGDCPWDLNDVAPPWRVLWEEKKLVPGKAIVPGCGRGHEVVFLAEKGFDVTGVDFAEGAVQNCRDALSQRGLPGNIARENFFALGREHHGVYDLLLEQTFFCAIHPSDRNRYVETAARTLKPGGLLAGLFYETGGEGGPPFNTTRSDVIDHFSAEFEIESLAKTPHSHEQRKGKEWLGLLRKR